MDLLTPKIVTDGGPWATHNMPCGVCSIRHAVYNLGAGVFEPCWDCRRKGWRTEKIPEWRLWLMRWKGWAK